MQDLSQLLSCPMSHLQAQLHSGRSLLIICEISQDSWEPTALECISVQFSALFPLCREIVYWQEMRLSSSVKGDESLPRVMSKERLETVDSSSSRKCQKSL